MRRDFCEVSGDAEPVFQVPRATDCNVRWPYQRVARLRQPASEPGRLRMQPLRPLTAEPPRDSGEKLVEFVDARVQQSFRRCADRATVVGSCRPRSVAKRPEALSRRVDSPRLLDAVQIQLFERSLERPTVQLVGLRAPFAIQQAAFLLLGISRPDRRTPSNPTANGVHVVVGSFRGNAGLCSLDSSGH